MNNTVNAIYFHKANFGRNQGAMSDICTVRVDVERVSLVTTITETLKYEP